ncbi:hypothetical protein D3C75_789170 [compost metagenome]
MNLVKIDKVGPKASQIVVNLGENRLARKAECVRARPRGGAKLSGDDDALALREFLEQLSRVFLACPLRIHIRGVKEVNSSLDGMFDEGAAPFLAKRPSRVA